MTLKSIIVVAREFVYGISAIRRFATIDRLNALQVAHAKASRVMADLGIDTTGLLQQLDQERAAHEETKRKLAENQSHLGAGIDTLNKFSGDYYRDFTELQKVKGELEEERATRERCGQLLTDEVIRAKNIETVLDIERAARQKAEAELEDVADQLTATLKHESTQETERLHLWQQEVATRAWEKRAIVAETEGEVRRLALASALETIDALTRWRLQSEEPCPICGILMVTDSKEKPGYVWRHDEDIPGSYYWHHTLESWEAARKAGPDAGTL